jgi:hypothetical protein
MRLGVAALVVFLIALFALILIPPHGWGWHVTPVLDTLLFGSAISLIVLGRPVNVDKSGAHLPT